MLAAPDSSAVIPYIGTELTVFAAAHRWKAYWASVLRRFVSGDVLDVGAGIGSNVAPLLSAQVRGWTALEPDPDLVGLMQAARARGEMPQVCRPVVGTLAQLPAGDAFDTILYIDVLEHIRDDYAEAAAAFAHLRPGGRLIVLVPAHQFLFSPFDAAIGHHRRYSRAGLVGLAPPGCRLEFCRMLDSVGFFASLANKLALRAAHPSAGQIRFWDRVLVPLSRLLDPLLAYRFGKSALAVWRLDA
jgi:SAM-dependent methyltransferase